MDYTDLLYGKWKLPPLLKDLAGTQELVRLRGITQDVLPASLLFYPISSRFHHGLGVAYLAQMVCAMNPDLDMYEQLLLLASAPLHDAGSPPFSHLGEVFLKERTGKDAEEFLGDVLENSETEEVLKRYGILTEDVVGMVTGRRLPYAEVLSGSIDLDNVDNIARYLACARFRIRTYNPIMFAYAFRFVNSRWTFDAARYPLIKQWLNARGQLYRTMYGSPRMSVTTMLGRAIEFAYRGGEIMDSFFHLTDDGALAYLGKCNPATRYLIDRLTRWQWYEEALGIEYEKNAPSGVVAIADKLEARALLANTVADEIGVPRECVSVYVGTGRERRHITLPIVGLDGLRRCCWVSEGREIAPVYRLNVFVPPELARKKKLKAAAVAKKYCGITS